MRLGVLMVTLLGVVWSTYATTPEGEVGGRKKVGLVLSGGGAKGAAHVRVLQVLEEAEIPIDYIAGTSMGAIVGGLYAIGYTPAELDSLLRTQDWLSLLSDQIGRENQYYSERQHTDRYIARYSLSQESRVIPAGILPGESVMNMLNELTIVYHEMESFDDLPIPFACVSYDIVTGEEYVSRSGSLPMAIRASMSIPAAFLPVRTDSMILIDGGVYNNFPVDVVRQMGAEIVIGVDLYDGPYTIDEMGNMAEIFNQLTNFLGEEKYEINKDDVDLLLRPNLEGFSAASFTKAAIDTILMRGEEVARENWEEILALRTKIGIGDDYIASRPAKHLIDNDMLLIGEIKFEGIDERESRRMMRFLELEEYSVISLGELNSAISRVRGTGAYSSVSYRLNNNAPYDLTVMLSRKRSGTINAGFRFDTEEMASILLNTTLLTRQSLFSPSASLTLRLSENPYGRIDFTTGSVGLANVGGSYIYRSNDFSVFDKGKRVAFNSFNLNHIDLAFTNLRLRNFDMNLGAQYEHFGFHESLYAEGGNPIELKPQGYINYYLDLHYDSLDELYYPTRGSSIYTSYTLHTTDGVSVNHKVPFASVQYSLQSVFPLSPRLTASAWLYGRTLFGNNATYPYYNFVGGEIAGRYMTQQLPFIGIHNVEIFDNSVIATQLYLSAEVWDKHYLRAKVAALTESDSFLPMFNFRNNTFGYALEYSYDSPLGPISLTCGGNSHQPWTGFYLSVGKVF